MQTNIALIALDLDGTLLQPDGSIAPRDREALLGAASKGVQLVASTGRCLEGIPKNVFSELDIRWALTANGAAVYDARTGEAIYERCMDAPLAAEIMRRVMPLECVSMMFSDGKIYIDETEHSKPERLLFPKGFIDYVRANRHFIPDLIGGLERGELRAQKIAMDFRTDPDGTPHDRAKAAELLSGLKGITCVCGGGTNMEITLEGVDKGVGLKALCDRLGITLSRCMAMGDSENDLALLLAAGVGVAMGDSPKHVRDAADYVTGTNRECGVAQAVARFVP